MESYFVVLCRKSTNRRLISFFEMNLMSCPATSSNSVITVLVGIIIVGVVNLNLREFTLLSTGSSCNMLFGFR